MERVARQEIDEAWPTLRAQVSKDAVSAQKRGNFNPLWLYSAGVHGPTCIVWASVTHSSLQRQADAAATSATLAPRGLDEHAKRSSPSSLGFVQGSVALSVQNLSRRIY